MKNDSQQLILIPFIIQRSILFIIIYKFTLLCI
jgi:hypothetical protein